MVKQTQTLVRLALKGLNLLLTNSIYLIFSSLEIERRLTEQSFLQLFLLWVKRHHSQSFKSNSCKKHFSPVLMLLVQLASMNLSSMITERDYFLCEFIIALRFFPTAILLRSLRQVF